MSDVHIRVTATDNASAPLAKVSNSIEDTGKAAKKSGDDFGKMSKGVKDLVGGLLPFQLTVAGVAAGLGVLAKQSIMAASDVEEMGSKFAIVFGDSAGVAEQRLGELADTIGRSRYELMGYAAGIQDTLVPLGMARDAAAGMSVEIVALAEDLASFNNMATADVMRALTSGLVGETEPLRQFGVVINAAAVEAKALEMGLIEVGGEMTALARTQATYQLILEGTADAQGDAVRTADGFANSMKALQGEAYDLQVAIGSFLLPAATRLVRGLTDAADAVSLLLTEHEELMAAFEQSEATVGLLLTAHEQLGAAFEQNEAAIIANAGSYDEYLAQIKAAQEQVGWLHRALQLAAFGPADLITGLYNLATGAEQATISLQPMTEEAFELERAMQSAALSDAILIERLSQLADVANVAEEAETISIAERWINILETRAFTATSAVSDLTTSLRDLGSIPAPETLIGTIDNLIAQAEAATPANYAYNESVQAVVRAYKNGEINAKELRDALLELRGAMEDSIPAQDTYAGRLWELGSAAANAYGQVSSLISSLRDFPPEVTTKIVITEQREYVGAIENTDAGFMSVPGLNTGSDGTINIAGPRAIGGPVVSGNSYLVGERGPEIVTMGQSGYVTPNHALGQTVNITINNPQLTSRRDIELLAQQVAKVLR